MRSPRDFLKPLALGAPDPVREIPFPPSRMIHFFDASNEKMAAKVPDMAKQADILLGNLEDAVPADRKEAAREGLVRVGKEADLGETPLGVVNVEEIATASPRMQGMSFGPADLAASRRMKTTRVGGGHPAYRVIEDPDPQNPEAERADFQQDPWHYSIARMVDACTSAGLLPFYGPFGDIKDTLGCEYQFRAAFLLGCVGAWSLHPVQIEIAKKVFSPPADEVRFAKKVLEAIPDGRGVHMIDGKMQDDATWKQCKVMVTLAEMLAKKDPELREEGSRGHPRRSGRAHDRRQDAGRRHLEAVQGDGVAGRDARREGPRAARRRFSRPSPTVGACT